MSSSRRLGAILFRVVTVVAGGLAPTLVHAQEPATGFSAGDVLVRARVAGLVPVNQRSSIDLIGGRVESPDMILPDADVTWFMTDNLALSGQAGVSRSRPEIKDSLVGDFPIGSIWSGAGTLSLQYHFRPETDFKPYIGVGAALAVPFKIEPAGGLVQDFEVDTIGGMLFQAGIDAHVTGNWYANAEAKMMLMPTYELTTDGVTAAVKQDTLVLATGVGYRF